ncbi:hypothetical protein [Shinella sp.]|uniref:hypothetical protein n=1 Tax=Shinella sp. TaxID=1870904 RepID=UPI0029A438D6|nr:hypothetical protein [Shinella sp.]MDX3978033.1 hypothetical protein [Shinella sp.]
MTKTLNTTFAAALVAASVFGGTAAFAGGDGDYYSGVSREPTQSQKIDRFTTQSIRNGDAVTSTRTTENIGPANGDYYRGVDRNDR